MSGQSVEGSGSESAADPAEQPDRLAPDPFAGPAWEEPRLPGSTGAGRGRRVRVSRRRRRLRRRRRRVGLVMLVLGGLIVLGGIWVAVTALLARNSLEQARSDLSTLRKQIAAGQLTAAEKTARDLAAHAHHAHELTTGPAWAIASAVPAGGDPISTVRGVTAELDHLGSSVLPALLSATHELDPATLRTRDGSIDLDRIATVAPELARASAQLNSAIAGVTSLPAHTWLAPIDGARGTVLSQLQSLGASVHSAHLAAQLAPAMLGEGGPKTYLVSFETEAELRGTGGLPGAFAIVRADHGTLRFTRFESDTTLRGVTSGLDFGAAYNQLYQGAHATEEYSDSNVSPHFPYAARIWVAMWQKYSGQHLDGAVAIDPTALSYLLKVTGPAALPDGTKITAGNVVAVTQQRVYAKYPSLDVQRQRKAYQLGLARAVGKQLLAAHGKTTALLRAAGKAAGERRLMVYSTHPHLQSLLEQTDVSGVVPQTDAPYLGLALNNAAANKLDYYLRARLRWERTGCGPTREVTATITVRNDAPAHPPRYTLGYTGRPGFPPKPGDNRLLVGYYATSGAQMTAVTLDGKPATAAAGTERGHPVYTVELNLPRGATRTVVLRLREPAGTGEPLVLSQPMVHPLQVSVTGPSC